LSSPQRISSSPWLRYGKECMHASQSRPYWDTGRPAIVNESASFMPRLENLIGLGGTSYTRKIAQ
jgi:hypothetical protein